MNQRLIVLFGVLLLVACSTTEVMKIDQTTPSKNEIELIENPQPINLPERFTLEIRQAASSSASSQETRALVAFNGDNVLFANLTFSTSGQGPGTEYTCVLDLSTRTWSSSHEGATCSDVWSWCRDRKFDLPLTRDDIYKKVNAKDPLQRITPLDSSGYPGLCILNYRIISN